MRQSAAQGQGWEKRREHKRERQRAAKKVKINSFKSNDPIYITISVCVNVCVSITKVRIKMKKERVHLCLYSPDFPGQPVSILLSKCSSKIQINVRSSFSMKFFLKVCVRIYFCICLCKKKGARCKGPHQSGVPKSCRSRGRERKGAARIRVPFTHLYVISLVTTRTEYPVVQKTLNKKKLKSEQWSPDF